MDTRIAPPRIDFRLREDDDESLAMAKAIHDVIEERIPSYVRKSLEPQVKEIASTLSIEMGRRLTKELDTALSAQAKEYDAKLEEIRKGMDAGFSRLVEIVKAMTISMPEGAIQVHVPQLKSADVVVHVPEQAAPQVNVTVPQTKPPDIKVMVPKQKAADIHVNVPQQAVPEVKVLVPEQAAPQVNVTVPPRGPVDKFFQYDEENRPVRIREVEVRE